MVCEREPAGTAIIIGASRGLGLGLAHEYLRRQWRVIATYRNKSGLDALRGVGERYPGRLSTAQLDMTAQDQVAAFGASMNGVTSDLLFINGGISGDPSCHIEKVETEEFSRVMETNALAPLRLAALLHPRIKVGGVIAAMSSNMGSVTGNRGHGWELYSASKAALGQLMKSFAYRNAGGGRTYLLISPGWVRTEMGGPHAPLDVETSVKGIADTIAQAGGKNGVHFVDYQGRQIDW